MVNWTKVGRTAHDLEVVGSYIVLKNLEAFTLGAASNLNAPENFPDIFGEQQSEEDIA